MINSSNPLWDGLWTQLLAAVVGALVIVLGVVVTVRHERRLRAEEHLDVAAAEVHDAVYDLQDLDLPPTERDIRRFHRTVLEFSIRLAAADDPFYATLNRSAIHVASACQTLRVHGDVEGERDAMESNDRIALADALGLLDEAMTAWRTHDKDGLTRAKNMLDENNI